MFDAAAYEYDRSGDAWEAGLLPGALLYRLTSPSHCAPEHILNGKGPLAASDFGRLHVPDQLTTYCANNVLVCIAEVLYHTYRQALKNIGERLPSRAIRASMTTERFLVVFRVNAIDRLVHLDSRYVTRDFDARACGTLVVFPDPVYGPLHDLGLRLRSSGQRGVLYPSARHSRDQCVAFFRDETAAVDRSCYEVLGVLLRLLPEDQDLSTAPRDCRPFDDKLHPTMGYYEFCEPDRLAAADAAGLINPRELPSRGMVDFVRRRYSSYPDQAVIST